jgi:hypothetical protein
VTIFRGKENAFFTFIQDKNSEAAGLNREAAAGRDKTSLRGKDELSFNTMLFNRASAFCICT